MFKVERRSNVFIVKFEHIVLVSLLLTLNISYTLF